MRNLFVFALFLMVSFTTVSQHSIVEDPWMKFSHLTKNDGLTSNYILNFLQDSEGYMWIATISGLNRYDGYSIRAYLHDPADSLSISNNVVTCLTETADSVIWIGTQSGLNYFDRRKQQFHHNLPISGKGDILAMSHIRALLADGDLLWIETADGNLHKYNYGEKTIETYHHNPPSMVNTYYYHALAKTNNGHLLLGGRYMGLLIFNPADGSFRRIEHDPDDPTKKRDEDVACYFRDSKNEWWVGGIDGCYTFNPETGIFKKQLAVSTFSIIEPMPGQIWIATGGGLYIFDQSVSKFRNITHNDNLPLSLSHNHINKLYTDRNRNVWLATLDGVSIYQPSQNKFKHIFHIPEESNSPSSNHITSILSDDRERIWIGMEDKGLDCFSSDWQRIYTYNSEKSPPMNLNSNTVSTLLLDAENDIWVGQWSGRGFNIINPDRGTNTAHYLLENERKADWYSDLLQDREGDFWVALWGAQGLYKFDKAAGQFTSDRFRGWDNLLSSPITNMAFDGDNLWLGTTNQNRFYCFDPKKEKVSFYSKYNYYPFDFNKIDSIRIKKGKVYFFTNRGIYVKTGSDFITFETPQKPYVALTDTTLYKNLHEISKAIGCKVYALVRDKNDFIWAATPHGLYKTAGNLPIARFHVHDGKSEAMQCDTVYCIALQDSAILWLGTEKGLVRFNIDTKTFRNYKNPPARYLSSHLLKCLFEDSKGMIWIGTTDNSLNCLDPKTGQVTQYRHNIGDPEAFWGNVVNCMIEDHEGNLWIGGTGLNKWTRSTRKFSHYTIDNGLTNNDVRAILTDHHNNLWISTANGLSCFDPVHETFTNYDQHDGLQENEFSMAACKISDSSLAFGGKNGLNIFQPDAILRNELPPPVSITGFRIFDKDKSDMINNRGIILRYNENYFSFAFTALDFSNPGRNQFAYKLENFDDDWIYTGASNREARYTNVDPGTYTFVVKASNNDGFWNKTGISIPVMIRPPFWKTSLFYVMMAFSLLTIILVWVKWREKKIREQNRYLLMEQRLLRSQMNPHFIFNSLSSIQSFIFENNPVVAGAYLSRFAELIRSILYNSREEFITLEKEIQTLQHYLELQQLRYSNKFSYFIHIDPEIETEHMKIPPMLAQPFIENAIEHGFKEIGRKGELEIWFKQQPGFIMIIVRDNGIGINHANRNKKEGHHSLATIITRERISILNKGRKNRLYAIQISDNKKPGADQPGTTVEIKIPEDD